VTKRLWFDLTATLRVAEHANSCDTSAGYGDYGREPCLLIATGQWPWTVVDDPLQPGVFVDLFVAWGPDGDRCTVCHAVDQLDHQAMPSMAGYGQGTSTRCRRCGSYETTDPIFGSHPHPAPWPPPPDQQATLDRQAMPDRQFERHGSRDPRHADDRRAEPDGQPRSDQPDQDGS
jgi:hypothetical protein